MKIHRIEINNYKAFHGKYSVEPKGKNLFVYGENGSGKSSLYYALKDFFQASREDIDMEELENIFADEAERGNGYIKVAFKPDRAGQNQEEAFELSKTVQDPRRVRQIGEANNLKSFLTYKKFLGIHYAKKGVQIDLFDLLANSVLVHYKNPVLTDELGALWKDCQETIQKKTSRSYSITSKRAEINRKLKEFNDGFDEMFKPDSKECIKDAANELLSYFKYQLEIDLHFKKARTDEEAKNLIGQAVELKLKYRGRPVELPQFLLNEARLTAIALAIYFASILKQPQGKDYKIIFLDDIFIGLDMSNRLPVLEIIRGHFQDYQVFITTYDKAWYEYARSWLSASEWVTYEFYAKPEHQHGFDIPLIKGGKSFIEQAEAYYNDRDYKAAAVYIRTAFEELLKKYCDEKGIAVRYRLKAKRYTTQDFWDVLKDQAPVDGTAEKSQIEVYRDLVMNPLAHYNIEKPEFAREVQETIDVVKRLKGILFS